MREGGSEARPHYHPSDHPFPLGGSRPSQGLRKTDQEIMIQANVSLIRLYGSDAGADVDGEDVGEDVGVGVDCVAVCEVWWCLT